MLSVKLADWLTPDRVQSISDKMALNKKNGRRAPVIKKSELISEELIASIFDIEKIEEAGRKAMASYRKKQQRFREKTVDSQEI